MAHDIAMAWIQPLAWELLHTAGTAKKKKNHVVILKFPIQNYYRASLYFLLFDICISFLMVNILVPNNINTFTYLIVKVSKLHQYFY